MRILFVGDIMGRAGREALEKYLPQLKEDLNVDVAIVNGENAAHGRGITEKFCAQCPPCATLVEVVAQVEVAHLKYLIRWDEHACERIADGVLDGRRIEPPVCRAHVADEQLGDAALLPYCEEAGRGSPFLGRERNHSVRMHTREQPGALFG